MLTKKTIAAFAAGVTLISGFAFATPAMADATSPLNTSDPVSYDSATSSEAFAAPAPAPAPAQLPDAPDALVASPKTRTYTNSLGTVVYEPGTTPLYDEALSGKFDTPAKPAPKCTNNCGTKTKKLPKTGAAVALLAVAASAIAGLGVAIRKFRH